MEGDKRNWIVRCILIGMAVLCWGNVMGVAHTEDNEAIPEILEMPDVSASFVDTDGYCVLPPVDVYNNSFFSSTRTLTKAHKQQGAKHTRYGSALSAGRVLVNVHSTLFDFSAANFALGRSESKPIFLCLRKLRL